MKTQLNQALKLIRLQKEWIMAVPADTPLPTMPGFDKDWADQVEVELMAYEPDEYEIHPSKNDAFLRFINLKVTDNPNAFRQGFDSLWLNAYSDGFKAAKRVLDGRTQKAQAAVEPVSDLRGIDAGPVSEWVDLVRRGYVNKDECLIAVKDIQKWVGQNTSWGQVGRGRELDPVVDRKRPDDTEGGEL